MRGVQFMPEKFFFKQTYTIGIRDIGYGVHMDHLSLLNYLHETRVRFLNSINLSEINVDNDGSGLVVSELNCKYRKECFYSDVIDIEMHLEKLSTTRLNFVYQVTRDGVVVASSVITTAFISKVKRIIPVPEGLLLYSQVVTST